MNSARARSSGVQSPQQRHEHLAVTANELGSLVSKPAMKTLVVWSDGN
jgi:hypothetical protein